MDQKQNEQQLPRWLNLSLKDLCCLIWWLEFGLLFSIWFETFPYLHSELHLTSNIRKITFTLLNIIIFTSFFKTVLGTGGVFKALIRWLITPFTILRLMWGFLRDTRVLVQKLKKNFPLKTIYIISLPTFTLLGLFETNTIILKITLPILFIQIAYTLYTSLRWSINPLALFEGLKAISSSKSKNKIIEGLISFDSKLKAIPLEKLSDKLLQWKKITEFVTSFSQTLSKPSFLFTCFMIVWSFSVTFVILASASILRIYHLTSARPVFGGDFFTGDVSNFLYIAAYQFVGSNLHGYEIISPVVQHVFVLLPYASMFLMVVVILAFSTVAQNQVDKGVTGINRFAEDILTNAYKQLQNLKMEVHDNNGQAIEEQKIKSILNKESTKHSEIATEVIH